MFDKDENYDALASEVKEYIKRFCYLDSEYKYDILTLWAFSTHCVDNESQLVFASHPRLFIGSDLPASGKTKVLEIVESLARKGKRVTDPSAPGLLTLINEEHCSLFIDELDLLLPKGNGQRPIRSILNSGYRPGAPIVRMGKEWNTYSPVAMAGLQQNFTTNPEYKATYSRSICVEMTGMPAGTKVDDWRERLHGPIADQLNNSIGYWARKNSTEMSFCFPDMPEGVTGRNADLFEPMIIVGQFIGPEWEKKAFEATRTIVLSESPTDSKPLSPMQQLLGDLSKVFSDDSPVLPTATILERLGAMPGSKWGKYPSPRAAAMELSATLRPLDISVARVSHEGRQVQGYRLMDLEDHFPEADLADLVDLTEEDPNLLPI